MHITTLFKKILNVNKASVKKVYLDTDYNFEPILIIRVEQHKRYECRCGVCNKKSSRYDKGTQMKRWRALDFGVIQTYIESPMPRVNCKEHGVTAQKVSWARHGSEFTRDFEDTVTWFVCGSNKTFVAEYMRINWRTVGNIITRVYEEQGPSQTILFSNLKNIGIDETAYKKGHKYITVIVNHDTGRVIWVGVGKTEESLDVFFKLLTKEQCKSIVAVTADGADYIAKCVNKWCPQAELCMDPFHVVSWATKALDETRRRVWNEVRKTSKPEKREKAGCPKKGEKKPKEDSAKEVKGMRYALLKNPENLTAKQEVKLEMAEKSHPQLFRAYLFKEELRLIFKLPVEEACEAIDSWRSRAWRCKIPEIVVLQKTIKEFKDKILKSIELGFTNARLEAMNNQIKVIIKMAYGFANIENLIALIMLRCSEFEIDLPGRMIAPTATKDVKKQA